MSDITVNQEEFKENKNRNEIAGPIICPGHSRPVPDVSFSKETADGYFLISGCLDNKAMLRDGASGDWIGTFAGHKGAVWSARLNNDSTRAVTASADFSVKLWDALTGDEMFTLPHKHIVKNAIFSKDGVQVYTAGHEKKLRIFDLNQPDQPIAVLEGHNQAISHVVAVDDHLIASAAQEKDIKIWDKRSMKVEKVITTANEVTSINQTTLAESLCVSHGKSVAFYQLSDLAVLKEYELPRVIDCLAYDPVNAKFVTGCNTEFWIRVYDFNTGEEIGCNKGHHGPVRSLAFNPHYTAYASGSEDGTIRIWDSSNKGPCSSPLSSPIDGPL